MNFQYKLKFFLPSILTILLAFPNVSFAQRGCCSWHGGINHCDTKFGMLLCNDGTHSPSCGCNKAVKKIDFMYKNNIRYNKNERRNRIVKQKLVGITTKDSCNSGSSRINNVCVQGTSIENQSVISCDKEIFKNISRCSKN